MPVRSLDQIDSRTLRRYRNDPCAFIEENLISPYDGELYRLIPAEREFIRQMFKLDDDGHLHHPLLLYSAIKKSRKTELAGIVTPVMILLFGGRFAEGFIVANDQEQAVNRCFTATCRIIEASPLLRHEARVTHDKIVFPAMQSSINAIASDYASIAGGHPTISVFDELWGFTSQRARRLWDELIPVPTRKISCRLVVTHAGFEGEGELLYELYRRGQQLPLIGTDLRAGDGMVMFWSHTPLHHWQNEKWLAQMRRDLPPNQFLRMIENRFTSTETSFIDMAAWDRVVDLDLSMTPTDLFLPIWIGVDASVKHDSSAIVAVTFDTERQRVRLVFHRIFQPSPDKPLDFELTIEATLLDLAKRFQVRSIWYDPYQMVAVAQRLQKAGLPVEEFPQTTSNLTAASQQMYDLIQGQAITLYPNAAIRLAASRAIAEESSRGWRITKEKSSHKIDVIVALAQACLAAVRAQGQPSYDLSYRWVDGMPIGGGQETEDARKAREREETDQFYTARLTQYLAANGAFGWPPTII